MIEYVFIDARGKEEVGRGDGVARDIYSSFWIDVSNSLFIGEKERVPFVRHDLYKREWEAIGKILAKGFNDTGYFPTMISKSFVQYCFYGDVSNTELLSSFLNYVSRDERMLIEKLLSDEANNDDFLGDEFLDFLDQFKCRTKVSKENVHEVIVEIARQEVIQKPHLMASCWQNVFTSLGKTKAFIDISSLNNLYRQLEPTAKKLITLLKSDPRDDSERDAFSYFKRFIRGLPESDLGKLVKFITGSDLLTVPSIDVTFIKYENEFSWRLQPTHVHHHLSYQQHIIIFVN